MKDSAKKPWNIFIKAGIALAVVLLLLGPVKDMAIRAAVIAGAKAVAGVDVKIGHFSLSLIRQSVKITDFKVYNPQGFVSPDPMVDIPEMAVKVDVPAFFRGEIHLPYLRLHVKEVKVIRQAGNALNVGTLAEKFKVQKSEKEMKMRFDLVSLNIGRVIVEDYSSGKEKPQVLVYDVNMKDKEFRNMNGPAELGTAVMFEALAPLGLDSIFAHGTKVLEKSINKAVSGFLGGLIQ